MVAVNMSSKKLKIDVQPDVLKWAIESSGWKKDNIGKELKIQPVQIDAWLQGKDTPSLSQLEHLAEILKRPLVAFFLPKPPEERPMPHDFRMLQGKSAGFSPAAYQAFRKARWLQASSKELAENLEQDITPNIEHADLTKSPSSIANRERQNSGINVAEQVAWKDPSQAFRTWKKMIETKNIMVFQVSIPLEDARGFSLIDMKPYSIVLSKKEPLPEARIFTLLHEYGHILLKESGICNQTGDIEPTTRDAKVESWCNEFAANFLMPKDIVEKELNAVPKSEMKNMGTITRISRRYTVSKLAFAVTMKKMGYLNKSDYEGIKEHLGAVKKKVGGGIVSPDKKCVSEKGERFISLVTENVNNGYISYADALDYLALKLKYYDKITQKGANPQ